MNFLTPWFLLGGLAVAGPILFHLIRRSARERMAFSSLLFLRPTPPRATRRRKLEHILLMLLRCLALLLLATGFERPFFSDNTILPNVANEGRQLIILVDTSASMRREGLWEKARGIADQYLDKTAPSDRVAVVTFDRQPRTLVTFSEWASWGADQRGALARQRLDAVSPGWLGTHLGAALTSAGEEFQEDAASAIAASSREIILITDLQEGAKTDGLQGHDWPSGVKVILERVAAAKRGNAGLEILDASVARTGDEPDVRVRVVNASDSEQEKFELGWTPEVEKIGLGSIPVNGPAVGGEMNKKIQIYLPPGQTRGFAAPRLPNGTITAALRLTGDDEPFDNTAWFVAPAKEQVTIDYLGNESANDSSKLRYYLVRAFPATPQRQIDLVSPATNAPVSAEFLIQADFAVIPAKLQWDEIAAMHDWVAGGKTALMVLSDAQVGPTLAALTGAPEIKVTEADSDYALLGEIDFSHPIFAAFADPRFSDFSHIHFWKHRRWEIPPGLSARVLAKFDDGSPALAQISIGKGNLLVLASGWNQADSQLAVSSKFLPLMQTILDWSGGAAPARAQFQTGEPIPSPVTTGDLVAWTKPDLKVAEFIAPGVPFTKTDTPGIYRAGVGDKRWQFAVNLPLQESRTAPMSPDELARLGVPLQTSPGISVARAQEIKRHMKESELENRQKLWRWLIAGLLAVALGEILLGGSLARRVKTIEVVP